MPQHDIRVDPRTAGVDSPPAIGWHFPRAQLVVIARRLIAIVEASIRAAEITIPLPPPSAGNKIRHHDRIHYLQRVPEIVGAPELRHRLGVAQMRVHVLQADLAPKERSRLGPAE